MLTRRHQQNLNIIATISDYLYEMKEAMKEELEREKRDTLRKNLLDWLSSMDVSSEYNAARRKHESDACDWLLKSSKDFVYWKPM